MSDPERDFVEAAIDSALDRYYRLCPAPPAEPVRVVRANGRVRVEVIVCADVQPQPWHSPDFRRVRWPGLGDFELTPKHALVVARLWSAREAAEGAVGQRELLDAADSDADRLADLFKGSPAWNRLVLPLRDGTYRLPD